MKGSITKKQLSLRPCSQGCYFILNNNLFKLIWDSVRLGLSENPKLNLAINALLQQHFVAYKFIEKSINIEKLITY